MDGLTNPADFLNNISSVGLVVLFGIGLGRGWWCTGRELREKNDTIKELRQALRDRDQQVGLLMNETLPAVVPIMRALHRAAGEPTEGSDG